jgi:transposase
VLVACEQDPAGRARFWEQVEGRRAAAPRLVFLDETGTNLDLTRRYGRAPKGERVVGKVPRNTPPTVTLVGALAPSGLITAMELDGAIDGGSFAAFVEHALVPVLRAGDLVILDNLSAHRPPAVTARIEATGARVLPLPAYSPDFNPIEPCFAKIKEFLRAAGARTRRKLHHALRKAIQAITPADVRGWFEHLGYWVPPDCKPL